LGRGGGGDAGSEISSSPPFAHLVLGEGDEDDEEGRRHEADAEGLTSGRSGGLSYRRVDGIFFLVQKKMGFFLLLPIFFPLKVCLDPLVWCDHFQSTDHTGACLVTAKVGGGSN
jgi:hypothetical protein